MRLVDMIVIAAIALALFGPKTLQSIARSVGKGAAQAKQAKDDFLAPIEPLRKVTSNIPLTPQHAVKMLIMPEEKKTAAPSASAQTASQAAPVVRDEKLSGAAE